MHREKLWPIHYDARNYTVTWYAVHCIPTNLTSLFLLFFMSFLLSSLLIYTFICIENFRRKKNIKSDLHNMMKRKIAEANVHSIIHRKWQSRLNISNNCSSLFYIYGVPCILQRYKRNGAIEHEHRLLTKHHKILLLNFGSQTPCWKSMLFEKKIKKFLVVFVIIFFIFFFILYYLWESTAQL